VGNITKNRKEVLVFAVDWQGNSPSPPCFIAGCGVVGNMPAKLRNIPAGEIGWLNVGKIYQLGE